MTGRNIERLEERLEAARKVSNQRAARWFDPRRSFATRLALSIVILVTLTLAAVTYITTQIVQSELTDQIGENHQGHAESLSEFVALYLLENANELQALAVSHVITDALAERNASYTGPTALIQAEIQALDERWLAAPDDDPFILGITANDHSVNLAAHQLTQFLDVFAEHSEVFVTDRYGATVAATGRLTDYDQSDETWWQAAWNDAAGVVYISDPEFDESAGVTALLIAVPVVNDETGETLGILRSTLNVQEVIELFARKTFGETGRALALDASGEVLFDPRPDASGEKAAPPASLRETFTGAESGFKLASDSLFGYAPLSDETLQFQDVTPAQAAAIKAVTNLNWSTVVQQDTSEALSTVHLIERVSWIAGSLAVALAGAAALFVARAVTRPLVTLGAAAKEIGDGRLDAPLPPAGSDEVGRLTAAFRTMTQRLRSSIRSLEARSAELSKANEGLQREISERKRAEGERQRVVSLVENSSDFIGVASLEGQMLFLNEAGQKLVGLTSLAESQAKSMYDFLMEDDLPEFKQRVLPAMMQEGRWEGEFRLKHFKTGAPIPVDMNSFTIRHPQTGEPMALATVSRDITERQRADEALRESEAKFRTLAETMTVAVVIARDKRILYVNPATEAVTGYSREELLRMDFQNVIHPDSQQLVQGRSASRERGEDVASRYELKILAKNGETRWLDIGSSSIEFEGSAAVLVTAFDVTERRRTDEALRESEMKFRSLAETVNVAVFIVRREKMLYVNPAAEALSGYTQEELLEMNFWDTVHPEVQETMRTRGLAKQQGESVPGERVVKIITKAGQERWVEFRVSTIMFEEEPAMLGAAFDVTERRQAEEALRASEEKYRTIFENVQDIFYQTDGTGIITEISPSVTRFGYTREELIGTSVLDVYEDPEERTRLVNALIEHGEVSDYEVRLKTGDGRVIDTSISARLLRNPDGTFAGSGGAIRDITERKQAERELEQALVAERERARRDPLTGVLNHAAIVEELRTLVVGDDAGPHTVAMIDADGLKAMNDSYGHQAGDEALVAVATALTRDGAIVGRYGGDEFVVVLPGADRCAAEIYCDVVSAKLADVRITDADSGTTVPVQASLGLAVYPEDAATVKDLIKLSDSAMYTAKRQRAAGPEGRALSQPLRSELVAKMAEEIMPLLTSPGDLKDKLRLVADRLAIGAGYDGVNFMLYSSTVRGTPLAGTRFGQVPHERAEGWMREYDRPSDDPLRQILERTRHPIILEDPQHDLRFTDDERELMRAVGVRTVLIAPIIWQHELIGSLSVVSKREAAFGPQDAEFVGAIAAQVTAIERMAAVVDELQSASTRLAQAHEETVLLLAAAAEAHDEVTGGHLQGVRALTEALAVELGYSEKDASATGLAAVLHDIGKIRVPKAVLGSTGLLADDEWELMKQHTTWGNAFLTDRPGFELAATIALCHHERWDGSGYPEGLAGDAILEAATIVTVADAFDAMVSDRPYRAHRPPMRPCKRSSPAPAVSSTPRWSKRWCACTSETLCHSSRRRAPASKLPSNWPGSPTATASRWGGPARPAPGRAGGSGPDSPIPASRRPSSLRS